MKNIISICLGLMILMLGCNPSLEQKFQNPPDEFKPMPFWHINGELTAEGIRQQMKEDIRK